MKNGVVKMTVVNNTIEKFISSPVKKKTKTEAKRILQNCGIIGQNGNIKLAYINIVCHSKKEMDDDEI